MTVWLTDVAMELLVSMDANHTAAIALLDTLVFFTSAVEIFNNNKPIA